MRASHLLFMMSLSSILSIQLVLADELFSMDDISSSLQMEYQSQLVLHPQKTVTARVKKAVVRRPPIKRSQSTQRQTQQTMQRPIQQRRVSPPRQPAMPVVKAPTANAEDLFEAATYGNVGLITRLLQQGINVNVANSERETALHMAAANGRYPAVIYLLNHGANINARTIKNWTPIHHAVRFRKANIVNYLMRKGASPYAKTSDGLSAIDMARTLRDQQLLRVLGVK